MFRVWKLTCLAGILFLSACDNSSNLPAALLPNTAPQGADASVTTPEDTPIMATLAATDPDGDAIAVTITDDVDNGTLTILPDGMGGFNGNYAPNADFNGNDAFSFTVSDGSLTAGPFTLSIEVTAVNDTPQASDATSSVNEDTMLSGMLVATDVDGDPLTFTAVVNPANGTLLVNADGSYTYTPGPDFNGADQFTFRASDATSDSNTATVAITVAAVNDAPVGVADNYGTAEDMPLTLAAPGVLGNDTDIENDTLTAAVAAAPVNGSVVLNADGSLTYAPNANFNGTDSFTYVANDGTGSSAATTVTVTVTPVNDAPVANALAITLDEDTTANAVLTGSDVENNTLSFAITTMPANGTLGGFDAATGMFSYTPNADYSGADSFAFRVNDGMADSMDATVTITVTPVNDAPTAFALSNTSLDEEQVTGTLVGMFSTTDADAADTHTYSLVAGAGDTDNASFAIVGDQLQSAAVLDFETQNSFSVRVQTDDGAGGVLDLPFVITVNDINDAPTDLSIDTNTVDENQAAGTAIGTLSSVDPDSAGPFTYTLVAGAGDVDNASFAIVGDQLQSAVVFDFETQNSFSVRVQTDDGAGGTFAEVFTITVNDINDAPTDIALSNSSIDENLAAGTAVGTLTSVDVDSAGPFTYALVAGAGDTDNAAFAIVGDQLQSAAVFDFETQMSFSVRVQTDDGAGGTFEVVFTVTVNDINDAPTDITLSNSSIDENLPVGTAVGTLTTADVDTAGPFTYTLVAGAGDTDNAAFAITGDQLQSAVVFDFEMQMSFSVRVQTDDGAGGTFAEVFTITVNDVNEAPTDIALSSNSIDENLAAGTAVGTLTTTDVDSAGPFTYTLVAGAGDTDNAAFGIAGDQLQSAVIFDFETQNSFSVRVQTDDGAGGTFEEAFTITVNDINDAPTDIALSNSSIDENLAAGTAVGTLTSVDVDSAGPFAYALVAGAGDTDNAAFAIAGDQLQSAAVFDFETQNSYSARVQTDDGAGGTFEEVFTITVNDVNDPPADIALDSTDVDENQPAGTPVGNFSSTDVDSAGPFTYTLVAGAGDTGNASFAIVGAQLQTAVIFDFNAQNSYSIRVQTDDGDGGQLQEVFVISINSLNDAPTDIALSSSDVDENQATGTAVGTLTSVDANVGDTHTYSLVAGVGDTDNASFAIVGDQLRTAAVFDFESQNSFSIRIRTDDGVGGTFEEAFTITVNNLNDDPTNVALDSASVDENEASGTLVGNLSTTDQDTADTHTYTLVAGVGDTDNAQFAIVGDQLQTAAVLNFEAATNCTTSASTCSIRVNTDDGNGGMFARSFIISINNVNDAPVATNDPYSGAIGNTLFQLTAAEGGPPFPPTVQVAGSIVSNDTDEDTADTLTVTANAAIPTIMGGSVNLDANGRFVYSPAAGFPGSGAAADSFNYEVCDDGTGPLCDTGTVTISGSNIVWYVDDSSPNNPGTGTAGDPFRNLVDAGGPSLSGETIFIFAGTQGTGITLKNNQQLLGEGVALVVNAITLVNPGTRPVINNVGGTAITLGANNTVRGLDIGALAPPSSTRGIVGTGFGTLTANSVSIRTTGGPALDLTNGAGSATFDSTNSSGSSTEGIDLATVSGSFTFGTGQIIGASGAGIKINSSTAAIDYSGTVTAGTGLAVDINQQTASSVSLSGSIASTAQGISLTNNGGGTITFSGGLNLSTGVNPGITATGGGTLNICDDTNCSVAGGVPVTNTIQNGAATALNVNGVNIGSDGLTFELISSNGGPAGIVLNNTGTAGGLTVTGDGSMTQGGNDTGGIIQNKTGDGISLTSTRDVTLQNMTIGDITASTTNPPDAINNIIGDGIQVTSVTNLALQSVTIARTGGHGVNAISGMTNLVVDDSLILNAGDGQEEHGLNLDELRGDNFVRDSQFDAFNETAIEVVNASGTVDLTISNTRFQDNKLTVGNAGEEAILIEALGSAQIVVLVTGGSVFDDIATQAIQAISIGSSSMIHLTVENSSFVEHSSGDGIIIMNPDGGGSGNLTVKGNTFTDDTFGPFAIIAKNDSSGTLDATIQNNTVDNMNMLNVNHDDIGGAGAANGTSRILVENNINNVGTNNISIDIIATEMGPVGTDPDLSVTVMNNTSTQPDNNFTFTPGLRIDALNNSRVNANIASNAFMADPSCCGGSGIEIRELDAATVRFQGFAGGDTAAATAFIDGQNPASSLPSFLFSSVDGMWGAGTAILPTPTTLPSP